VIEKIWFKGFRNLTEIVLDFQKGRHVFISGKNNQGKTNFLEAIHVVLTGKSPRESDLKVLQSLSESEFIIGLITSNGDTHEKIYIKYNTLGFQASVDQKPFKSFTGLKKKYPVVFVSSDVVHTFQDSPSGRRKVLDDFCLAHFTEYKSVYAQFERTLKQKNTLLKDDNPVHYLDFWNRSFVEYAENVVQWRLKGLEALKEGYKTLLYGYKGKLPGELSFIYNYSGVQQIEGYKEQLYQKLCENSKKECAAGFSLYGPHRDDFDILSDNRSLFKYFSRGINKAVAFLLIMVQYISLQQNHLHFPILLLDDSFSEVDEELTALIFEKILDRGQIFYTSVMDVHHPIFNSFLRLTIQEGKVAYG
jgi:DNA replication and repair protein RecF